MWNWLLYTIEQTAIEYPKHRVSFGKYMEIDLG